MIVRTRWTHIFIIPVIIGTIPGNKLTKGAKGVRSSVYAYKFRSAQV